MRTELAYYDIFPKVLCTGAEKEITIVPLGRHVAFKEGEEYILTVVPMYERRNDADYQPIRCKAHGGRISFRLKPHREQPYWITLSKGMKNTDAHFKLYALEQDLYETTPYMGDFHAHTCASDGHESPEYVAAAYRQTGFDFLSITDHHHYYPSVEAIEAYQDTAAELVLFTGEEVHPPDNPIHTVSFGGDYSVNDIFQKDPARYYREVAELKKTLTIPDHVNEDQYASLQWVYKTIQAANGMAIFPHPHWIDRRAYHVRMDDLTGLFESQSFDAFELVGGQTNAENMMQIAFYHEMRASGKTIPIVGGSDSHGVINSPWFQTAKTVVFAMSCTRNDIIAAVKSGKSVAVEQYGFNGEKEPRVYGLYRMVAFADFLLREYFPVHDELCFEEGRLMRDLINGVPDAQNRLSATNGQVQSLINKYWGR